MYTATVSPKGWVVIPKDLRKKYGLETGKRIRVVEYAHALVLVPLSNDPVAALYGMLKDEPSLTADLLAEHARERMKEDVQSD